MEPKSNILYLRVLSIADESLAKKPKPPLQFNYQKPTSLLQQWNFTTCFSIKGLNMKKLTIIVEKVMHAEEFIVCVFFTVTCMHWFQIRVFFPSFELKFEKLLCWESIDWMNDGCVHICTKIYSTYWTCSICMEH